MPRTPTAFVILLTLFKLFAAMSYWEDYELGAQAQDVGPSILEEAKKMQVTDVLDYPPYVCYDYRSLVLKHLDEFTGSLKAVLKAKSMSQWVFELITGNMNKKLHADYLALVSKSFSYFLERNVHKAHKMNPENDGEDVFYDAIAFDPQSAAAEWVQKVHSKTFWLSEHPSEFVRDNFDYRLVGEFHGKLLYNGDFNCMEVPELSLVVFKLFYFKIFDPKFLGQFFEGFFGVLEGMDPANAASALFTTDSVNTFFGYNLLTLLGFKSIYAQELLSIFSSDPTRKKSLVANFVELYSVVLEAIELAEKQKTKDSEQFMRDLLTLKAKAVKKVGKTSAFFAMKFVQSIVVGYTLTPFDAVTKFAIREVFSVELSDITKTLKDVIDPEDKGGDEVTLSLESVPTDLEITHLKNFLGYFEEQVASHKNCVFCALNLKNQKQRIKNLLKAAQKQKRIII